MPPEKNMRIEIFSSNQNSNTVSFEIDKPLRLVYDMMCAVKRNEI